MSNYDLDELKLVADQLEESSNHEAAELIRRTLERERGGLSRVGTPGEENPQPIGTRDAFHVGAVYVESHVNLKPGQRIRIDGSGTLAGLSGNYYNAIVDPFIDQENIEPYTGFWALVRPSELASSMRHTFRICNVNSPADALTAERAALRGRMHDRGMLR